MNIVCATDGNYLPHCAAMLQSLVANAEDNEINIYLILDNVSTEVLVKSIEYLWQICPALNILKADPSDVVGFPVNGHATVATYFRLLLPGLLPSKLNRVIFIDSDAIVTTNLNELWNTPLHGKALAAVPDHWLSCRDHGYVHGEYFNAGIMLIDLERWRSTDILDKGRSFALANPHRLRHWDQDVLNHVFKDDWVTIGERWNACPHLYGLLPEYNLDPDQLTISEKAAISDPAIIHFAGPGPIKPWNARCLHPLKHHYLQAKSKTPWADQPLDDLPPTKLVRLRKEVIFKAKTKLKGLLFHS
jgi:lipopolysaccharide biosynthesis glycosyltransferase